MAPRNHLAALLPFSKRKLILGYRRNFRLWTTKKFNANRSSVRSYRMAVTQEPEPQADAYQIAADRRNSNVPQALSPLVSGACLFFVNYVVTNGEACYGYFQYLQGINAFETIGLALSEALAAIGLNKLAVYWKAPAMTVTANRKYASAVRLVKAQISNSKESMSDQTLITVMALGLYEANTCSKPCSMGAWTEHIKGAVQILYLRENVFKPPSDNIYFCHSEEYSPIPVNILEWSNTDLKRNSTTEGTCFAALNLLNIKFASLRSTMSAFHDYSHDDAIIASPATLDREH
ncbi:hypothetical protein BJ878DRAFT_542268 [Calycina marina]|uniref:Uncharacterized protein n=1 Tax=Calycina marina TaxID=1763456 RepID=A0A9P7Z2M9_9HELO|nr:hypothetical protein BJ878DRAFT_542268 [Calycina marina]